MPMAHNKKRILCIEDEAAMIELTRVVLEQEGFEVLEAIGGTQGLEIIRRERPDLVLLDLMMPDVNGWEVYRQMKADETLAKIPVIVITARSQAIDKVLGLQVAKVDGYIIKPFALDELLTSIENILSRQGSG